MTTVSGAASMQAFSRDLVTIRVRVILDRKKACNSQNVPSGSITSTNERLTQHDLAKLLSD